MTELLSALLGALLGGAVSAWASARQTAKVLKHETDLAADERREAEREARERRVQSAADHLIAALADFTTMPGDSIESPVVTLTTAERARRKSEITRNGVKYAHVLPSDIHQRWETFMWWVRYTQAPRGERTDGRGWRDRMDLFHYAEYLRRSLVALAGEGQIPPEYVAPDPRRKGERPWGFNPEAGATEPDLTDWSKSARIIGTVRYTTGEMQWFGPGGRVENLPSDQTDDEGE
jgi:hypothetical protein